MCLGRPAHAKITTVTPGPEALSTCPLVLDLLVCGEVVGPAK